MTHSEYPLISVVIPVYNGAKVLERSVLSVINDKYQNKEIIVVDDGSTDETSYICQKLLASKLIRYQRQENAGANSARNCGLRIASGSYVQFLDCDDELINDKLFFSAHRFFSSPNLVCVYTDARQLINEVRQNKVVTADHKSIVFLAKKNPQCFTSALQTSLPLWKREFLIKNQLYWDESLPCWQESEYYTRAIICMRKLISVEPIEHLSIEGILLHRGDTSKGISSGYWSEKYILGQRSAIIKIVAHLDKENLTSDGVKKQFKLFLKLLFIRSIVGGTRLAYDKVSCDIRHYYPIYSPLFLFASCPYFITRLLYLTYKALKFKTISNNI